MPERAEIDKILSKADAIFKDEEAEVFADSVEDRLDEWAVSLFIGPPYVYPDEPENYMKAYVVVPPDDDWYFKLEEIVRGRDSEIKQSDPKTLQVGLERGFWDERKIDELAEMVRDLY